MKWNELQKIDFERTTGAVRTTCPACSATRKNKNEKCVRVDYAKGEAYCHHCGVSFFKEDNVVMDDYTMPTQTWKNYTSLDDKLVKYLEGRKIPQYVTQELRWTQEEAYNPSAKKKQKLLCFNSFEKDVVVNKKYRTGKSKVFIQSTGGKPILYNINSAVGQKKLYLVEGEIDVASLLAIGVKNVASIPSANDNDNYWINSKQYLKDVKYFVIATDNDDAGNVVADKISHRLGKYRCTRVKFENKDANGDLVAGVLERTIKKEYRYPVSGVFTPKEILKESLQIYDQGVPETIKPKSPCFTELNKIFSTMRGHLVTVTGIPSSGKSSFIEWYVLNISEDYNMKVSFYSPEHHPLGLYNNQLAEKYIGKSSKTDKYGMKMSKEELIGYADWAEDRIYYLVTEAGDVPTWDWYLLKLKEQIYSYGIDIFLIDSWTKLLLPGKRKKLDEINDVLIKLTSFCQANNVIIFLVAHPTKMYKREDGTYPIPQLYDVSGSADFYNQTHDGIAVHREREPIERTIVVNLKTKFFFQGEMGEQAYFNYQKATARYYPYGTEYSPYKIGERPPIDATEELINFSESSATDVDDDFFEQ